MGRGGIRHGAGSPGFRAKAEGLYKLCIRSLVERNYLEHVGSYPWGWKRDGQPCGDIAIQVDTRESITLRYTVVRNGTSQQVNEVVRIAYVQCPFGGTRAWFECPRCPRRTGSLYLRWGRFACRQCQKVAYASQSEDELHTLWRKIRKIEAQLAPDWQRPKGMWRLTYAMLMGKLFALEEQRDEAFTDVSARLFGRFGL